MTKRMQIATRENTAVALEPRLAEAVRTVLEAAESPNTRRAYAAQFRKFTAWCERRKTKALPATPAVVATYLVDLAETGADPSEAAEGLQGRDRRACPVGNLSRASRRRRRV